jgi:hypothetical protein
MLLGVVRRNPTFGATVVVTLALGIGANTAVFSIVSAVLLRPLAYRQPEELVAISSVKRATRERDAVSQPDLQDWSSQARSFTHIAAYAPSAVTVTGDAEQPERLRGLSVTGDLFSFWACAQCWASVRRG